MADPRKCFCCQKIKIIHSTKNGIDLCVSCYKKNKAKEKCSICGKVKRVETRAPDGGSICNSCYKPPIFNCPICGSSENRAATNEVCIKCYKCPKENCSICEEIKEVYKRKENGEAICIKCYEAPKDFCSVCNKVRIIAIRNDDEVICKNCFSNNDFCTSCGKLKKVCYRLNEEVLCLACRNKVRCDTDENFRTKKNLKTLLWSAYKRFSTFGKIQKSSKYGINYEAIIEHLGPCPGSRDDYHIDHIIPLAAFNFDNSTHIKAAFDPENHRWLKKKDNMKKSSIYDKNEFESYIKKFVEEK